jgi:four helix bundle protein
MSSRRLDVCQLAVRFLPPASDISAALPRRHAALAAELGRASLSVPLNIAKGSGKTTGPDQHRFCAMARGSAMECAAIMDACVALELVESAPAHDADDLLVAIVRMLSKMCLEVRRPRSTSKSRTRRSSVVAYRSALRPRCQRPRRRASASPISPGPPVFALCSAPAMQQPLSVEDHRRRGLSPRAVRIVRAFAEALLADSDPTGRVVAPAPELLERVVDELDRAVGAGSADLQRGLGAVCFAIDSLPPIIVQSFSRMTSLGLAARVSYLEALESSRVGLLATFVVALKIPLVMCAYEVGEELAMTGFDRDSLSTARGALPIPRPWGPVGTAKRGVS